MEAHGGRRFFVFFYYRTGVNFNWDTPLPRKTQSLRRCHIHLRQETNHLPRYKHPSISLTSSALVFFWFCSPATRFSASTVWPHSKAGFLLPDVARCSGALVTSLDGGSLGVWTCRFGGE